MAPAAAPTPVPISAPFPAPYPVRAPMAAPLPAPTAAPVTVPQAAPIEQAAARERVNILVRNLRVNMASSSQSHTGRRLERQEALAKRCLSVRSAAQP